MKKLPLAKNDNVVVQQLDKELLIYNLISNKAFCLNQTSAIVFNACDGSSTFEELKSKHKFTDDLIFLALDELEKQNLLQKDEIYQSPFAGITRREVIKKVGLATMIALPVIVSVVAPIAAAAASSCSAFGQSCPANNGQQTTCCENLRCGGTCFNCFPTGNTRLILIVDIGLETNFCCSSSSTTTPVDATRVDLTCL